MSAYKIRALNKALTMSICFAGSMRHSLLIGGAISGKTERFFSAIRTKPLLGTPTLRIRLLRTLNGLLFSLK